MNDVLIRAEGLGKKYLIAHRSAERERYMALRDVIGRTVKGMGRKAFDAIKGRQIVAGDEIEEFWALRNISFEVKRGEVLGVIGRNGAGKSTLLKVLSRITEPTEGRVSIRGRVASLLEVGTGFHPELTGRENIYLNGAILGMTRSEIRKKFDEIVAFAEVENFLDTPVKRYSSGMYVRLAFAVAAHLEPEILVVDEVLAVGDARFQKKCLGKMTEVAGHGRTVLFVSHNMVAVRALCRSGLLLSGGRIETAGAIEHVVAGYVKPASTGSTFKRSTKIQKELVLEGVVVNYRSSRCSAVVAMRLRVVAERAVSASIDVRVKDGFGGPVAFASLGALEPTRLVQFKAGENICEIELGVNQLAAGIYRISIDLTEPRIRYFDRVEDCVSVTVDPIAADGATFPMQQAWGYGSFRLPLSWMTETETETAMSIE